MATGTAHVTSGGPGEAGRKAHPEAPGWEVYWDGSRWTEDMRRTAAGSQAGTYTYEIETPWNPDDIPRDWLPTLTDIVSGVGYKLETMVVGSATYNRRYSPGIFWVGYILFFPFGLLLLLARPVQPLSVAWSSADGAGGSSIRIVTPDRRLLPLLDRIEGSRRIG